MLPDKVNFTKRVLIASAIPIGIVLVLVLVNRATSVFLLLFAGILLALLLRGVGDWLAEKLHVRQGWGLLAVVLCVAGIIALLGFFLAPHLVESIADLWDRLRRGLEHARQQLAQYQWGRSILSAISRRGLWPGGSEFVSRLTGVFSSTLGVLGSAILVLFVGLYLAVNPSLYRNGLISLFPMRRRRRMADVLDRVAHALRMWLLGKILAMLLVGVLVTIGLLVMGIPLPFTLGLIAALLTFVPNFGPVASAVPAVLLGLLQGWQMAVAVAGLYLGVQTLESYFVTPVIQRKTARMPPALIFVAQVLLAALAGILGVIVATPIVLATMVLIQHLYIGDGLGDPAYRGADEGET